MDRMTSKTLETQLSNLAKWVVDIKASGAAFLHVSKWAPGDRDGARYQIVLSDEKHGEICSFPRHGHRASAKFKSYWEGIQDALDAVQRGQLVVKMDERARERNRANWEG